METNPLLEQASAACRICSQLNEKEYASQKYGWEENDTSLPEVFLELECVKDLKPNSDRLLKLFHCPLCNTYYLYATGYEYLVNGSEDFQSLTRLSPEKSINIISDEFTIDGPL